MVVSEGVPVPLTLSCLLLLPDKQSSSASLETLLALLQAEGAKIEEDTEVNPASPAGRPRAVTWAWAQFPQGLGPVPPGPGVPAAQSGQPSPWVGKSASLGAREAAGAVWSSGEGYTLHCESEPVLSASAGWAEPVGTTS